MSYVELHASSAFSFLRGASFPEQLAEVAAELEMPALGLLDRNGVYGSQRFSVAAREQKVRPIIGAELTMEDGSVLPVLVASRLGYANLCSLLTQAHLRSNVKGECAVKWEELPDFAQGLITLFGSGSAGCQPAVFGSLPKTSLTLVCQSDHTVRQAAGQSRLAACAPKSSEDRAQCLIDTFGRENVYVEIQRHLLRGEDRINQALVDLASKFRLALIATNGVQYAKPSGRQVLDVFTCIREHTHLDLAGKLLTQNAERHLKSDAEMCAIFRDLPDAITNTERLAERLEFSLENIGYEFPEYAVPDGHTMNSFLRTMVLFGAQQRYESITKKVKRQLEEELSLINRLGFAGYFLIVGNVISCRGRSAAREIGKALNFSPSTLDRFSHLFATGDFPHTLELEAQIEQAGLPKAHPRMPAFVGLYHAIYGLPRHLGQHSGGMIICQNKLSSFVPLENASMPGRVVAQWDKDDCEDLGIVKVDLLGLGMMSVMQDAFELCQERGRPIDLAHIPTDDPRTYKMMQEADTIGVFQIESRAQMATLPRMKPECFYDVVIEVAIIRRGTIQAD